MSRADVDESSANAKEMYKSLGERPHSAFRLAMGSQNIRDLTAVLSDSSMTWAERRTRLQGWRGLDADRADAVAGAQRLAPALCALGAFAGALTGSWLVLAVFAVIAVLGVVAPSHPFESVYNRWAASSGRPTLPRNRAARRLGCVVGVGLFGAASAAFAIGATTLGLVLALIFGGAAGFIAVTGICVPSILFTLLWGVERACVPSLLAAATCRHGNADPTATPMTAAGAR